MPKFTKIDVLATGTNILAYSYYSLDSYDDIDTNTTQSRELWNKLNATLQEIKAISEEAYRRKLVLDLNTQNELHEVKEIIPENNWTSQVVELKSDLCEVYSIITTKKEHSNQSEIEAIATGALKAEDMKQNETKTNVSGKSNVETMLSQSVHEANFEQGTQFQIQERETVKMSNIATNTHDILTNENFNLVRLQTSAPTNSNKKLRYTASIYSKWKESKSKLKKDKAFQSQKTLKRINHHHKGNRSIRQDRKRLRTNAFFFRGICDAFQGQKASHYNYIYFEF